MFFLNQAKDAPLLQEIIREGVINSALWESLQLPGEGHLMDVLVDNAPKIPEKSWLDWLIRKHNCTRIPSLMPSAAFIKATDRGLLNDCLRADCYPLSVGEKHLYVGIGRPDMPEVPQKLGAYFQKAIIYRNSLTINEVADVRQLCQQALQTM